MAKVLVIPRLSPSSVKDGGGGRFRPRPPAGVPALFVCRRRVGHRTCTFIATVHPSPPPLRPPPARPCPRSAGVTSGPGPSGLRGAAGGPCPAPPGHVPPPAPRCPAGSTPPTTPAVVLHPDRQAVGPHRHRPGPRGRGTPAFRLRTVARSDAHCQVCVRIPRPCRGLSAVPQRVPSRCGKGRQAPARPRHARSASNRKGGGGGRRSAEPSWMRASLPATCGGFLPPRDRGGSLRLPGTPSRASATTP